MITAYLGRENVTRLSLQELQGTDIPITPNTVIRVTMVLVPRTGKIRFCIDTDSTPTIIQLVDADTAVDAQFGLIVDLLPGDYQVYTTVFDGSGPNGIAWGPQPDRSGRYMTEPSFPLRAVRWPICS